MFRPAVLVLVFLVAQGLVAQGEPLPYGTISKHSNQLC
jgi:hypothetical protein